MTQSRAKVGDAKQRKPFVTDFDERLSKKDGENIFQIIFAMSDAQNPIF